MESGISVQANPKWAFNLGRNTQQSLNKGHDGISSTICGGLGSITQATATLEGDALVIGGAEAILLKTGGVSLPLVAYAAQKGFEAVHTVSKKAGDIAQSACHATFDFTRKSFSDITDKSNANNVVEQEFIRTMQKDYIPNYVGNIATKIYDVNRNQNYSVPEFTDVSSYDDFNQKYLSVLNQQLNIPTAMKINETSQAQQRGRTQMNSKNIANSSQMSQPARARMSQQPVRQVVTESVVNRDTQKIISVVTHFTEAFTNINAKGFETEPLIIQRKKELDDLKRTNANSQLILNKGLEIKNAQVAILAKREEFANNLQHGKNVVNAIGILASITGHQRFAQQVMTVGKEGFALVENILGFLGKGSLAGITASAATGNILACLPALIGLFQKQKEDPSQALSRQMTQMMLQIQSMFKEVFARLDGIEFGIEQVQQQNLQYFLLLKLDNSLASEKIDLFESKLSRKHETFQEYAIEILNQLEQAAAKQTLTKIRDALLLLRKEINRSVDSNNVTKPGLNHYDHARADIKSYYQTQGAGVDNPDLIGKDFDAKTIHNPNFALHPLNSYYEKSVALENRIPTVASVYDSLKKVIGNQQPFKLNQVITIQHLLEKQPINKEYSIDSLGKMVDEKTDANKIVLIPVYIQARWSLLIIDVAKNQSYFLTLPNNNAIAVRIQNVLSAFGFKTNLTVKLISTHVMPRLSHLWLIDAIKLLDFNHLNESTDKMLFVKTSLDKKLDFVPEKLKPINPLVLNFIVIKLLELTHTQYPELGNKQIGITSSELSTLKELLELSDTHYQMLAQFYDPNFFTYLINECVNAEEAVESALRVFQVEFEAQISKEINHAARKSCASYLDSGEISQFMSLPQSFPGYGNWWSGTYVTVNPKKGEIGSAEHCDANGLDTAYVRARTVEVNGLKRNYVTDRQNKIKELAFNNTFSLAGEYKINTTFLPVFAFPAGSNQPVLRVPTQLFSYLNKEVLKHLMTLIFGLGKGKVEVTYEIRDSKMFFDIYYSDELKREHLSRLSVAYDPLFYSSPEAEYNFAEGGVYSSVEYVETASSTHTKPTSAGNTDCFSTFVPTCSYYKGLYEKLGDTVHPVETLDEKSDSYQKVRKFLQLKMDEAKKEFHDRYQKELKEKMEVGELGRVIKSYDDKLALLHLFSQLILPNILENNNSTLYKVFNTSGKQQKVLLLELRVEIRQLIENNAYARNYEIDKLQQYLLNCLNLLAPHLRQVATASEQAKYYKTISALVDTKLAEAVDEFRINSSNQTRVIQLANQVATGMQLKQKMDKCFEEKGGVDNALLQSFGQLFLTETNSYSKSSLTNNKVVSKLVTTHLKDDENSALHALGVWSGRCNEHRNVEAARQQQATNTVVSVKKAVQTTS